MEMLIPIALRLSVAAMVFALGLQVTVRETIYLFPLPGLLLRSVLSMNIAMPVITAVLVESFNLHPAVKIALVLLSISPVPPLLPMKRLKTGRSSPYIFSLLATEAILSILSIPVSVFIFESTFGVEARASPLAVAQVVLLTIIAPLGAGMAVRSFSLELARRIVRPVSIAAAVMIALSVIPILFIAMPAVISLIGDGTLAAIVAFVLAGLGVGHHLGGPASETRTVLALSTSSRHPAVALTIASANFAGQPLVPAAVLLYMIVSGVLSIPYLMSRRPDVAGPKHPVINPS